MRAHLELCVDDEGVRISLEPDDDNEVLLLDLLIDRDLIKMDESGEGKGYAFVIHRMQNRMQNLKTGENRDDTDLHL